MLLPESDTFSSRLEQQLVSGQKTEVFASSLSTATETKNAQYNTGKVFISDFWVTVSWISATSTCRLRKPVLAAGRRIEGW